MSIVGRGVKRHASVTPLLEAHTSRLGVGSQRRCETASSAAPEQEVIPRPLLQPAQTRVVVQDADSRLARLERDGAEEARRLRDIGLAMEQRFSSRLDALEAKLNGESDQITRLDVMVQGLEDCLAKGQVALAAKADGEVVRRFQSELTEIQAFIDPFHAQLEEYQIRLEKIEELKLVQAHRQPVDLASKAGLEELRETVRKLQNNLKETQEEDRAEFERANASLDSLRVELRKLAACSDQPYPTSGPCARRGGGTASLADPERDSQTSNQLRSLNGVVLGMKASQTETEKMMLNLQDSVKALEQRFEADAAQLQELGTMLKEKVDVDEVQELVGLIHNIQQQVLNLGCQLTDDEPQHEASVSSNNAQHDQELRGSISSLHSQIVGVLEAMDGKAAIAQVQQLMSSVEGISARLTSVQTSLLEASGTRSSREDLSGIQMKISTLETSIELKADLRETQQLREAISSMQAKMPSSDRLPQLESAIAGIRREVASVERAVQGKADLGQIPLFSSLPGSIGASGLVAGDAGAGLQAQLQLQQLKSANGNVERKLADLEQSLQDKASLAQVQACKRAMSGIEARFSAIEQAAQDKADTSHIHQLRSNLATIQSQVTAIEQGLSEKASNDDLQETKVTLVGLRAQLGVAERATQEKAPVAQVQQLRSSLMTLETKLAGLEQAVQEKASAVQLQRIRHSVGTVQARVAGLVQERGAPVVTNGGAAGYGSRLRLPATQALPAPAHLLDQGAGECGNPTKRAHSSSVAHWPKFHVSILSGHKNVEEVS